MAEICLRVTSPMLSCGGNSMNYKTTGVRTLKMKSLIKRSDLILAVIFGMLGGFLDGKQ
jgi:hypothetical protein